MENHMKRSSNELELSNINSVNLLLNNFAYLFVEDLYVHNTTLESGILVTKSDKQLIQLESGSYRPYLGAYWTKVGVI
jgi:hypothetical protein